MARAILWCSFGVFLLLARPADAQEAPPARQILDRARQGRVEFLSALRDVERFSPEVERKEEVYPYVLILDELDDIGRDYGLESLGMNPVRKAGAVVTRHAAKWIHFKDDDWELLAAFFKWAEDHSRFSAIDHQTLFIWRATGLDELLVWNQRVVRIMERTGELGSVSPYVLKGLESLNADLAKKLLAMRDQLSDEEFLQLATTAVARTVLDEIAGCLHNAVLETTDVEELRRLVRWTIVFGHSIRDRGLILPSFIENIPGQTCLEAIMKLAYQGRPAEVEIVDDVVDILSGSQLIELASVLSQLAQGGFHGDAAEFLAALGRQMVHRSRDLGITRNRVELERAVGRLAMAEAIQKYELAGLYRCGSITITLVEQSDVNLCVGVTLDYPEDPALSVDTSLCRVLYDLETDEFVAYKYLVRDPYEKLPLGTNAEMRFTLQEVDDDLRVQGTLALGRKRQPISARRIKDLNYPASSQPPVVRYTGTYAGTMNGQYLQLTISKTNDMAIGWAFYTPQRIRIDFPFAYFDRNKNAVYLTTEQLVPTNVKHLRGVIDSQGKLEGVFVVGGSGKTLNVQLQKQKEKDHAQELRLGASSSPVDPVHGSHSRGEI